MHIAFCPYSYFILSIYFSQIADIAFHTHLMLSCHQSIS
jgi:hypothetical protein